MGAYVLDRAGGACGIVATLTTWIFGAAFIVAATVVWVAGLRLSTATDAIDDRFGLGDALGGLILLAFATNLPEIAITASAALEGHLALATGNLLGGIAIQTLVFVGLDAALPPQRRLTSQVKSMMPLLECLVVILVLSITLMGTNVADLTVGRVEPMAGAIVLAWLAGILIIRKVRGGLSWKPVEPPGAHEPVADTARDRMRHPVAIFVLASVVTLIGGVVLERTGDELATRLGMDGIVFGATILAGATTIPEISSGLASVRRGDIDLAFSDILGGNAFLPILLLFANVLSGSAVLAQTRSTDRYLAAFGIVLTAVVAAGLLLRPRRRIWRIGVDMASVAAVYLIGLGVLIFLAT